LNGLNWFTASSIRSKIKAFASQQRRKSFPVGCPAGSCRDYASLAGGFQAHFCARNPAAAGQQFSASAASVPFADSLFDQKRAAT